MLLSIRRCVERLLGVQPVAPGEDTAWRFRFSLGWPDWLLVLFAVFAVATVLGVYLRESGSASRSLRLLLAAVRLAVVGLVLVMLGGLDVVVERTGLPYLVFLLDDSESMTIRDAPGDQDASRAESLSRFEQVRAWLRSDEGAPLGGQTSKAKLLVYVHSNAPRLVGACIDRSEVPGLLEELDRVQPTGTESRIGANLRTVLNSLRGTPPCAVVLVTDGVTTAGEPLPQAAQYAARKNIPIFTVGVGDPGEIRDREIRDLLVDEAVFVGDLVTFEAKVASRGFPDGDFPVQLKRKGSEEPIDEKTVSIPEGADFVRVELSFRPAAPGVDVYEILVPVDPAEIVKDNNRIERRIEAVKERMRVLYVESYPRYEFRFLKALLEREETIELSVLLADADPEYLEEDKFAVGYFPTTREELYEFDVVVLGDVSPALLSASQLENVRDFVRIKGGGVVFIAGENYSPWSYRDTPLEDLLPVELGSSPAGGVPPTGDAFQLRTTLEGRVSPIFRFGRDEAESRSILEGLPQLYWYAGVERAKPAAVVLAEHPSASIDGRHIPLVATQFFGAGRTFYQGFTGTWRWRNRVENLYFGRYWIQAVRWLSRSKLLGKNRTVDLALDRKTYRRGDPVQVRARILDESLVAGGDGQVAVVVERVGGVARKMELARRPDAQGVYEGVFTNTEDGDYQVRLIAPVVENADSVDFRVSPPPGELDRVRMNEAELKSVAEATGGRYYRIADADRLFADLPAGRKVAIQSDAPVELWNTWPVLALFAGLLAFEWILRKRKGMV
jgi:uncharacterized membrane protein